MYRVAQGKRQDYGCRGKAAAVVPDLMCATAVRTSAASDKEPREGPRAWHRAVRGQPGAAAELTGRKYH